MESPKWLRLGLKIFDALGLITLGVVLFLNVTNILPWSMWINFFKFWPVFIVLAGVSIILEMFELGKLISKGIGFLVFVTLIILSSVGVSWSAFNVFTLSPINSNVEKSTYSKSFEREDLIGEMRVKIDNIVGEFKLENDQTRKDLAFKYDSTFPNVWGEPEVSRLKLSGDAEINVDQRIKKTFSWGSYNWDIESLVTIYDLGMAGTSYDLSMGAGKGDVVLTNSTITDFVCEIGAGESSFAFTSLPLMKNFDLSVGAGESSVSFIKSKVEKIDLSIGAGETTLTLDELSSNGATMNVSVGAGRAILNIPKEVGMLLTSTVGLGDIDIDGTKISGIGKQQDEYKSSNYDTATSKLTITASVGVGSLEINYK